MACAAKERSNYLIVFFALRLALSKINVCKDISNNNVQHARSKFKNVVIANLTAADTASCVYTYAKLVLYAECSIISLETFVTRARSWHVSAQIKSQYMYIYNILLKTIKPLHIYHNFITIIL